MALRERVRVAAAGDVHAAEPYRERLESAFASVADEADLVLLAGDLTNHGTPEEAAVLAHACRVTDLPVIAVLGNHDHHEGRADEVAAVLREAGVTVLERGSTILSVGETEVGVVGTKGFVGGFDRPLPDFGEPLLRRVYQETTDEALALTRGLQDVSHCELRIVLLHYAPVVETLQGEPVAIHAFLGSARLATPIAEYQPDLVVHGHAHAGTFEGRIGVTPVYNVAIHVTGRDFYVFDLEVVAPGRSAVGVETPPPL